MQPLFLFLPSIDRRIIGDILENTTDAEIRSLQPMNLYQRAKANLEKLKCQTCQGLGKCDDADLGDISYNEWTCLDCNGTGISVSVMLDSREAHSTKSPG